MADVGEERFWHLSRDGKQYGPFSHQELLRWAQNAELLPTDLVWKAGFADWMPASSIPGLLKPSAPEGPKPAALDPDTFDKGEKINRCADELRRLAVSQTATESDAIVALQTALGNAIAATVLARNPTFLPDQKLHVLDQMLDAIGPGVRETAYIAADLPSPPQNEEGRDLTEDEFVGLTSRIINEATKNNTPVGDGLSATAKAIGVMISILAERPDVSAEELIKCSQDAVAEFARAALDFRASQKTDDL